MELLNILYSEKSNYYSGEIYHKAQINLTYNSNHLEGSRLTYDHANEPLSETFIKTLHQTLNSESRLDRFFSYVSLKKEKAYLRDTCLTTQDRHKRYLDYFRIRY